IVIRNRVAGAPDRELGGRIIGAGLPEPAAAGLPGVVLILPGLAAGLARLRYGVPAPQLVAGAGVERRHPAARSTAGGSIGDDHLSLGGDGRRVESFLGAELVDGGDLLVPDDLARVAVERDHPTVRQVRDHEIFPECDAARARQIALVLHAGIADPDELALVRAAGVDLVDRAPAVAGIHEAIDDQRIDLAFRSILPDVLHAPERERPDESRLLDVVPIDLAEPGIAVGPVVAVHHEPVLRLVRRVHPPLLLDPYLLLRNSLRPP